MVYFFTSSNEAVCACLQRAYGVNAPRAHEIMPVEQLFVIGVHWNNLINVPETKPSKKSFQNVFGNPQNGRSSASAA